MTNNCDVLLALTRYGIGHQSSLPTQTIDWHAVQDLATKQGLSAVILDGIEELRKCVPNVTLPEKKELTQWIGEVLQGYEYRYELYRRAIAEMAEFYNSHGYKMMVLKGYACSLDWPKPEHRPIGDIDIWLFGKQKEADAVLSNEKGIDIDNGHHHHTIFCWRDFTVENHYDFVNIHKRKSFVSIEKQLKELGKDDSHHIEVYGETVYHPSPNLNALFLIVHLAVHFTSESITIRQVLDWAFFVKAHSKEIDWEWFNSVLEDNSMKDFFNSINAICVEDLGFESCIFNGIQFNPSLKEKIMADIMKSAYIMDTPQKLVPRLLFKLRRWKGNAWKRNMCFKDSGWSVFWESVWAHIAKPHSI